MRAKLALAVAVFLTPAAALADPPAASHTIFTTGYGEILVAPDQATIDIGVIAAAPSAEAALHSDSAKMARVVAAIKGQGIEEASIQTSEFSIDAVHPKLANGEVDESRTTGYSVTNKVTVLVHDLTKVAAIVDAALTAGANASNAVSFDVKDHRRYDDQAMAAAVRDARHRAEIMAAPEHATVGGVLTMSSVPAAMPMGAYVPAPEISIASDSAPPILPGQITITAQAYVTFTLNGP